MVMSHSPQREGGKEEGNRCTSSQIAEDGRHSGRQERQNRRG